MSGTTKYWVVFAALCAGLWALACGDRTALAPSDSVVETVGPMPPVAVAVGGEAVVEAADYFRDPNGDAVTYVARTGQGGVAEVTVEGGAVRVRGLREGTAEVTVTARSATGATGEMTFSAHVASSGICNRTAAVRDSIMSKLGVTDCAAVDSAALAGIDSLDIDVDTLIAGDFAGLTGLTYLDLDDGGLTTLPAGVFSGLTSLWRLDLSENGLTTLPAGVFSGLTSLWRLDLSENGLTTLPAGVFSGLTALEDLYLSYNALTALPAGVFSGLTALEYLGLRSNDLTALPAGVFSGLTALELLRLEDNDLTTLPAGVFSGLAALERLWLYANDLTALPAGVFSGLTALELLYLQGNDLPAGVFSGLTALKDLSLFVNGLTTLPAGVFSGLTALEVLWLSGNDLTTLPVGVFSGLTALKNLSLPGNRLTTLPAGVFSGLTALEVLGLSRNDLTTLPAGVFSGLTALKDLFLHHNRLTTLPVGVFSGLTALEGLRLEDNDLTTLPAGVFSGLTALERLWLNNNDLMTLPAGVFSGLTALEVLGLSRNDLTTLPAGVFSGLTALEGLRLEDNDLTTLPAGVFSGLTALDLLWLYNNDLTSLPDSAFHGTVDIEHAATDSIGLRLSLRRLDQADLDAPSPARVRLEVAEGTPADLQIGVSAAGGTITSVGDPATTISSVTIPRGSLISPEFVVTLATDQDTAYVSALPPDLPDANFGDLYVEALDSVRLFGQAVTPPGIAVDPDTVEVDEGGTATFTVVLESAPSAAVTVTPSSADMAAATVSGALTFTAANWNAPQTVTVTGAHDDDAADETTTIALTATGGAYGGTTATVTVVVTDDDAVGIVLDPTQLAIEEGDTATVEFTAKLATLPSGTVTVSVSRDNADVEASPDTLTFTSTNWDSAQAVAVSANHDADAANETATITLTGSGGDYGGTSATVTVTVEDDDAVGICDRTAAVRDSIMSKLGATDCAVVDSAALAGIDRLTIDVDSLQVGDFALLTELAYLDLSDNGLTTLPDGVFRGLTSLEVLRLRDNDLTTLPPGLFSGLAALAGLGLGLNDLTTLPVGVFSGLTALDWLDLYGNDLTTLPAGLFSGLTALEFLHLGRNQLTTLPAGAFNGLTSLGRLILDGNGLTALPAGTFSGLTSLEVLGLRDNDLTALPAGVFSGLTSLTYLRLDKTGLTALPVGLFSGLAALGRLRLDNNDLTTLPDGLFSGLTSLGLLDLSDNDLTTLPDGLFSGLTALGWLDLTGNDLTTLPAGLFSGLAALKGLRLDNNDLTTLPDGLFSGLTSLGKIDLSDNDLTTLPAGVFSGLTALDSLWLTKNDLTTLPDSAFHGTVDIDYAITDSIGLRLSLRRLDHPSLDAPPPARVRLEVAEGTPADLQIGLSAAGGTIMSVGDPATTISSVTIPRGSLISPEFVVTLAAGQDTAFVSALPPDLLDANFGDLYVQALDSVRLFGQAVTPPGITVDPDTVEVDEGGTAAFTVVLESAPSAAVTVTPSSADMAAATVSGALTFTAANWSAPQTVTVTGAHDDDAADETTTIALTATGGGYGGTTATVTVVVNDDDAVGIVLDPTQLAIEEGDTATVEFTAKLATLPSGTVTVSMSSDNADVEASPDTLTFTSTNWDSAQAVAVSADHDDDAADETATITLTGSGGDYGDISATVTVTVDDDDAVGICDRTAAVRDSIMSKLSATDCAAVNSVALAGIDSLTINVDSLKVGDFALLSGLSYLNLANNDLTTLPAGVFGGLTALEYLSLSGNDLTVLPAGVFGGLTALRFVYLRDNGLTTLPDGVFSGLTALEELYITENDLTTLPAGVFGGLTSLTRVSLYRNHLTTLPAGVFNGLAALEDLDLRANDLMTLPAGVFSGLTALEWLYLGGNDLATLPADVFSGLTALETLYLDSNRLTTLPAGVFSGLSALGELFLDDNDLTTLPTGVFNGLTALDSLSVDNNDLTTLPDSAFHGTVDIDYAITDSIGLRLSLRRLDHPGLDAPPPARVRLEVAEGTPADLQIGVSAAGGTITSVEDSANTISSVTIPRGSLVSPEFVVRLDAGQDTAYVSALPPDLPDAYFGDLYVEALDSVRLFGLPDSPPPGLVVDPDTVAADEGGMATFTVVLESEPSDTVTVTPSSADTLAVTVDGALTFTTANWNTPQTVTVAGAQDDDAEDETVLVTLAAIGGGYDSVSASVTVNVADDDVIGIVVDPTELTIEEGDTATVEFTAKLATLPSATVTVLVSSDNADVEASADTLTFTATNWDSARAVAVSADHDADAANETATIALAASGGGYDSISATITVTVADDETAGICNRTPAVRDSIMSKLGATDCAMVGGIALAGIDRLTIAVDALAVGDFAGLSGLWFLDLDDVTTLPAGVFDGLTALQWLNLAGDDNLSALPAGVFNGLTALRTLWLDLGVATTLPASVFGGLTTLEVLGLSSSNLTALPAGTFSGLTALTSLFLSNNDLTSLPAGLFGGLTALKHLDLSVNELSNLPAGVFSGLTALERLHLLGNRLTSLPAGVFGGLTELSWLRLHLNELTSLPAGVFSGLTALEAITLNDNELTTVPAGLFSGLTALESIALDDNELTALPVGVFSDLTALASLTLDDNELTTLPDSAFHGAVGIETARTDSIGLRLSLTRLDQPGLDAPSPARVRLEVAEATPTDLQIGVSAVGGTISSVEDSTSTISSVTIPRGAIASPEFRVNLDAGQDTAYLSALPPDLPNDDFGELHVAALDSVRLFGLRRGITVGADTVEVDEDGTATFTVALATRPSAAVTVTPASADTLAAKVGGALTFTAANWNVPQVFTVEGVQDDDGVDETVAITLTASGARYGGVSATTTVAVDDDDPPGLVLSTDSLTVMDHETDSLMVRLATRPSDDVTVTTTSSRDSIATVSPAQLVFDTVTWNTPQPLRVTGAGDANRDTDMATVAFQFAGAPEYALLSDTTVIVTVLDNRAPEIAAPLPVDTMNVGQTISVPDSILYRNFTDPDGDPLTFDVTSGDPSVLSVVIGGGQITITGVSRGSTTATLQATDSLGLSASQTTTITVNGPPEVAAPIADDTINVGDSTHVALDPVFDDQDSDDLAYAASSDANSVVVQVRRDTLWVTGAPGGGSASVIVTATDSHDLSVADTFTVTTNRAPEVADGAPSTLETLIVGETETFDLDHFADVVSDPDADPLSYTWQSSDATVVGTTTTDSTVTLSALSSGTVDVTVTATDPGGLSAELVLSLRANSAPVVADSISAQSLYLGDTLEIDAGLHFSDPDSGSLSYEASVSPSGFVDVTVAGNVVTLVGQQRGSVVVSITATDPDSASVGQSFDVVVPNRAPVSVATLPDRYISMGQAPGVNLAQYFVDPDGDPLGYSAQVSDASVVTASVLGSVLTLTGVGVGAGTVTITARDPSQSSGSQTFAVTFPAQGVGFQETSAAPTEGDTALFTLVVEPVPTSPISVRYTVAADNDNTTDDADSSDYVDVAGGVLQIPAGTRTASLAVAISDDDDIEPTREAFLVTLDAPLPGAGYTLATDTTARVTIAEGVCDRTPQIRDRIVTHVGYASCDQVDDAALSSVSVLNARSADIVTLKRYDFMGLSGATQVLLGGNELITSLPDSVFATVPSVTALELAGTSMTTFSEHLFAGMTSLSVLFLQTNRSLTSLASGVFSGLPVLNTVELPDNNLTSLPPGLFDGVPLGVLNITPQSGVPFELEAVLSRVDDASSYSTAEFQLEITEGTPTGLTIPFSVTGGSSPVNAFVFAAGSRTSSIVSVDRTSNTMVVSLTPPPPDLPSLINGVEVVLGPPFTVRDQGVGFQETSAAPTEGDTAVFTVVVEPIPTSPISVRYTVAADNDITTDDADSSDYVDVAGGVLQIPAGTRTASLAVAISDDDDIEPTREAFLVTLDAPLPGAGYTLATDTTARVTIAEGVCDRTPQIRDRIVTHVGYASCDQVDDAALSSVNGLNARSANIVTLKRYDFMGLSGVTRVLLGGNPITSLPDSVFATVPGVTALELAATSMTSLSEHLFAGMTSLDWLLLQTNTSLTSLASGVFSGLPALNMVQMPGNNLASLPPGLFDGVPLGVLDITPQSGVAFELEAVLSRVDDGSSNSTAEFQLEISEGTPTGLTIPFSVTGGTSLVNAFVFAAGSRTSSIVSVDGTSNTTVISLTPPPPDLPSSINGVEVVLGPPLTVTW